MRSACEPVRGGVVPSACRTVAGTPPTLNELARRVAGQDMEWGLLGAEPWLGRSVPPAPAWERI